MEALNQRDSRWAGIPLGTSTTTTIGSHGCTITCVAMLAGLTPDEVNRRLLQVGGYQNTNLIIWSKIKEAIPWLEFEWRGYSYENAKVADAIAKYSGCLVQVDFDGKIDTPRDDHWVVYKGNQKMIDPWTGAEKATSYYPIAEGYSIIKVSAKPVVATNTTSKFDFLNGIKFSGHLENTLKYLFIENTFSEGDIREGMSTFKVGTNKHLEGVIAEMLVEKQQLENTVKTLTDEGVAKDKIIEQLKKNQGQSEEEIQQRLDNQKKSLTEACKTSTQTALNELRQELSPKTYYEQSATDLLKFALLKMLGVDIKSTEGVTK